MDDDECIHSLVVASHMKIDRKVSHPYSIQVSHGPKDRAEPHNGLLLSARLSTLDASPGVLRHFCKVPRGEHGNDTVAHARSYCVVVQVEKFCEILPHSSGHLQPACSA